MWNHNLAWNQHLTHDQGRKRRKRAQNLQLWQKPGADILPKATWVLLWPWEIELSHKDSQETNQTRNTGVFPQNSSLHCWANSEPGIVSPPSFHIHLIQRNKCCSLFGICISWFLSTSPAVPKGVLERTNQPISQQIIYSTSTASLPSSWFGSGLFTKFLDLFVIRNCW